MSIVCIGYDAGVVGVLSIFFRYMHNSYIKQIENLLCRMSIADLAISILASAGIRSLPPSSQWGIE